MKIVRNPSPSFPSYISYKNQIRNFSIIIIIKGTSRFLPFKNNQRVFFERIISFFAALLVDCHGSDGKGAPRSIFKCEGGSPYPL